MIPTKTEAVAAEARKLVDQYVPRGNPQNGKLYDDILSKVGDSDPETAISALRTMARVVGAFEGSVAV